VAIIVEALTDNRNRTAADVRSVFTKHHSSLGAPGSVAWQFDRKGVIQIPAEGTTEDDIVLGAADAGAEDAALDGEVWQVTTAPTELAAVRDALEANGLQVESAELRLVPRSTIGLDEDGARKLLRLIDGLEDLDDVQDVYANFDIPDAVLEAVAG
jgi:YebC/PmpR family DNA-binding regulatory protein